MMKEVLRAMETGVLAEIGLLAFVLAFVLVIIRVATMKRDERAKMKNLPLQDAEELKVLQNNE